MDVQGIESPESSPELQAKSLNAHKEADLEDLDPFLRAEEDDEEEEAERGTKGYAVDMDEDDSVSEGSRGGDHGRSGLQESSRRGRDAEEGLLGSGHGSGLGSGLGGMFPGSDLF